MQQVQKLGEELCGLVFGEVLSQQDTIDSGIRRGIELR